MKTLFILVSMLFFSATYSIGQDRLSVKDIEKLQIQKFKKYVSRNNNELSLLLSDGSKHILKTNLKDSSSGFKNYIFKNYFKDLGYYLILVGYYEWRNYLLINQKTGDEYKLLCGAPVFSPSRERFVTTCCGGRSFSYPNGIQVWKVGRDELKQEYSATDEPNYTNNNYDARYHKRWGGSWHGDVWGYKDAVWHDESKILAQKTVCEDILNPPTSQIILQYQKDKWKIQN